jgi:hypothetical protein
MRYLLVILFCYSLTFASIDAEGGKITNVGYPSDNNDAANYKYVNDIFATLLYVNDPNYYVFNVNNKSGNVILTTSDVNEGTNLYYTDARARASISETVTGLSYSSGVFSLTTGYVIPTTVQEANWSDFITWFGTFDNNDNDPCFYASIAADINQNDVNNWNGKISDFDETDPCFAEWYLTFDNNETDPCFVDWYDSNNYLVNNANDVTTGALQASNFTVDSFTDTISSKFSYKVNTITPTFTGIYEMVSDTSYPLPDTIHTGFNSIACFNPDVSIAGSFQFAGYFSNQSSHTLAGTMNNQRGLYGSCLTTIANNGRSMGSDSGIAIAGLDFQAGNQEDFVGQNGKGGYYLTTAGISVFSTLGWTGKTISNYTKTRNYGGYFTATMDGTYNNALTTGVNYGVYTKTTNSIVSGTGSLNSYALYLDACSGSTFATGGGVLTSWNLYAPTSVNSAINGMVRIGSTTVPTVPLDVTGDVNATGTVKSTGLIVDGNTGVDSNFLDRNGVNHIIKGGIIVN